MFSFSFTVLLQGYCVCVCMCAGIYVLCSYSMYSWLMCIFCFLLAVLFFSFLRCVWFFQLLFMLLFSWVLLFSSRSTLREIDYAMICTLWVCMDMAVWEYILWFIYCSVFVYVEYCLYLCTCMTICAYAFVSVATEAFPCLCIGQHIIKLCVQCLCPCATWLLVELTH